MKITVVGSGAMGSVFGGILAEGGHDVTLFDTWCEHVKAINENGLHLSGVSGDRLIHVRATCTAEGIPCQDLIIILVKSGCTAAAAEASRIFSGPGTMVLTLQNGLGNLEVIASILGPGHAIGGTTSHGAFVLGPGAVRHAGAGETILGEFKGGLTPRVERLAETLSRAGLPARAVENTDGPVWSKLLVNAGINALTALLRVPNGVLTENPWARELLAMAVEEGAAIARGRNIVLSFSDPVAHCLDVAAKTGGNISSMLQDVRAGRKTEIGVLNLALAEEGKKMGIPAPVNSILASLVQAIENSYRDRI